MCQVVDPWLFGSSIEMTKQKPYKNARDKSTGEQPTHVIFNALNVGYDVRNQLNTVNSLLNILNKSFKLFFCVLGPPYMK